MASEQQEEEHSSAATMGLHMNGGEGRTSYANNSVPQREMIYETKQILEEAVRRLCSANMSNTMRIADLGCSSGPNSLLPVTMILYAIHDYCGRHGQPMPDFHIFLNDMPENDFNHLFKMVPTFLEKMRAEKGEEFRSCYVSGSPGSFYGRLFLAESLHFVYSANSLHWLSKVPSSLFEKMGDLNKGNIALGKTSSTGVFEVYLEQFRRDFHVFLKSRSQEIVPKGCMVLSFMGRRTIDPFSEDCLHITDILTDALRDMVGEGIVEEAKMDSFNMPYYEPHVAEVQKVIEEEGSFEIIQLEEPSYETDYIATRSSNTNIDNVLADCVRAASEPMLSSHFGPAIIDELFTRFQEKLAYVTLRNAIFLVISLTRKG